MIDLDALIDTIKQCKHVPETVATELCEKAIELLVQEGNVVAVQAPMTVCGDIHGQLHDLLTLFETGGQPPLTQYLFLGDFVDRGFYLVELFLLLLAFKVRYPDRITLIRGNHELRQITTVYGFYDECVRKYGLVNVWRRCCDVFDYLALGAVIQGYGSREGVFCVHGGLSPVVDSIDQIRVLDRKQEVPHEGAMCDLLWLDPEEVERWSVLPRGAGFLFGNTQTREFLHKNQLSLIARAHQLVMEGYREMFDGRLVTVWLAPNYCYRCGNVALVLVLDEQLEREYRVFEAAPHEPSVTPNYKPAVEYFI